VNTKVMYCVFCGCGGGGVVSDGDLEWFRIIGDGTRVQSHSNIVCVVIFWTESTLNSGKLAKHWSLWSPFVLVFCECVLASLCVHGGLKT